MGEDPIWDALERAADRLTHKAGKVGFAVVSRRRKSLFGWRVVEGLWLGDDWTDVFEPVRWRRLLGDEWLDLQSVREAASNIEGFLRERPDLS